MSYRNLQACVTDLEKNGHLIRIKDEVDPYLQMAAIHLRVFENEGPAILFENVKGSKFPALSNLFGTLNRSKFIFRDTLNKIKTLVDLKSDPIKVANNDLSTLAVLSTNITGILAFLASVNTASHPVSTTGATAITSTFC